MRLPLRPSATPPHKAFRPRARVGYRADVEYALATHFRSGVVQHRVEPEGLVITREKSGTETIPFADLTEINLRQDMPGAYTMRVRSRSARTVTIPSRHFAGVGQFHDRSHEYVAFVRALHDASSKANPSIRYTAGSSVFYAAGWFLVVAAVVMCLGLVYGVLFVTKPPPLQVFFVVPMALLVGGGFVRQGRAKPYDPSSLPERLIPLGEAR